VHYCALCSSSTHSHRNDPHIAAIPIDYWQVAWKSEYKARWIDRKMSDTFGDPVIAPGNEDTTNLEALMRRSSPLVRSPAPPSPLLTAATPSPLRSSSASPLRLTRPRSNPRTRTPMRYESPLNSNAFRIDEEPRLTHTTGGQRITIRPLAGSAVGATVPTGRVSLMDESRFVGLVLCILSLIFPLFDYTI
jgi:hypothetical protein